MEFALLFLALLVTLGAGVFSLNMLWVIIKHSVPFVPAPAWAREWLVANMGLTSRDTVYDLGCGDARILAALAKAYPEARFVGIEAMWWPYLLARWRSRHISNLAIHHGDFLTAPIGDATHVFIYLIPKLMTSLEPKLRREAAPGTTVWSYGFDLPGWTEPQTIRGALRGRLLKYTVREAAW